jgi:hypothetical protein
MEPMGPRVLHLLLNTTKDHFTQQAEGLEESSDSDEEESSDSDEEEGGTTDEEAEEEPANLQCCSDAANILPPLFILEECREKVGES